MDAEFLARGKLRAVVRFAANRIARVAPPRGARSGRRASAVRALPQWWSSERKVRGPTLSDRISRNRSIRSASVMGLGLLAASTLAPCGARMDQPQRAGKGGHVPSAWPGRSAKPVFNIIVEAIGLS